MIFVKNVQSLPKSLIREKCFPVRLGFPVTVKMRSCTLVRAAETTLFDKRRPLDLVMCFRERSEPSNSFRDVDRSGQNICAKKQGPSVMSGGEILSTNRNVFVEASNHNRTDRERPCPI